MKHLELSIHIWPFWWRLDFYKANRLIYLYVGPFAFKLWLPG